ncbi:hypothetical protein [Mycolicibacterium sp. 624]|uniref:hypothetical protein n=1 Tax=Mycolicibacterium sp. 624 TaxID=3156314 RepID=UPI0033957F0F
MFPGGKNYDEMTAEEISEASSTYIQSGGSAERLSVEIRRREGNRYRQYVVGHFGPSGELTTERILLGPHEPLVVRSSEVFDADEAAQLFLSWFKVGAIPDGYSLRELNI